MIKVNSGNHTLSKNHGPKTQKRKPGQRRWVPRRTAPQLPHRETEKSGNSGRTFPQSGHRTIRDADEDEPEATSSISQLIPNYRTNSKNNRNGNKKMQNRESAASGALKVS
nr:hypothetical protein Iba_chr06eCG6490 [Ipomoea batatas]